MCLNVNCIRVRYSMLWIIRWGIKYFNTVYQFCFWNPMEIRLYFRLSFKHLLFVKNVEETVDLA